MKDYNLTYKTIGSSTILIEWPTQIDPNILEDILAFKHVIESNINDILEEAVSAYASLTLYFKSPIDLNNQITELPTLYNGRSLKTGTPVTWNIPVCYEEPFATDLINLSKQLNLSSEAIIEAHCAEHYTIYFSGFLPGFLYLGGLNPILNHPRKKVPNIKTIKGSVGIGGEQTGIYPIDSPGGWNIIGNTPIEFFDKNQDPPCFCKPGEKIKFNRIDLNEHTLLAERIKTGNYSVSNLK